MSICVRLSTATGTSLHLGPRLLVWRSCARATSPERNDLAGVPERKEIMFTREKISEVESGKCQM